MSDSEMNELLAGALKEYGLGLTDKDIENAVKRLPTEAVSRIVDMLTHFGYGPTPCSRTSSTGCGAIA